MFKKFVSGTIHKNLSYIKIFSSSRVRGFTFCCRGCSCCCLGYRRNCSCCYFSLIHSWISGFRSSDSSCCSCCLNSSWCSSCYCCFPCYPYCCSFPFDSCYSSGSYCSCCFRNLGCSYPYCSSYSYYSFGCCSSSGSSDCSCCCIPSDSDCCTSASGSCFPFPCCSYCFPSAAFAASCSCSWSRLAWLHTFYPLSCGSVWQQLAQQKIHPQMPRIRILCVDGSGRSCPQQK